MTDTTSELNQAGDHSSGQSASASGSELEALRSKVAKLESELGGAKGYSEKATRELREKTALLADREAAIAAREAELSLIKQQSETRITELSTSQAEKDAKLKKLESREEVARKLAEKHPELIPWHLDGILRAEDYEGEERDAHIERFAKRLQDIGQSGRTNQALGSTPKQPTAQDSAASTMNVQDHLATMNDLINRGKVNTPEYEAASRAYRAALLKK